MRANEIILSRKNDIYNRLFIDFWPHKWTVNCNRLFGPYNLIPCKVDSKISSMKRREVYFTGAHLQFRQPECFLYQLKSTFCHQKNFEAEKIDFGIPHSIIMIIPGDQIIFAAGLFHGSV